MKNKDYNIPFKNNKKAQDTTTLTTQVSNMNEQLTEKATKVYATPKEYGAKADGTTNDSTSFQNMLTDGVKFILTEKGTHLINSQINVTDSATITGENRKNTILKNGTGQLTYATTIQFNNASNSVVSNLTLDGNIANVAGDINSGVSSIKIKNSTNITVRDVNVVNNKYVGIMIADSQNLTFDNCYFNNIDSGINAQEGTGLTDGVRITNCVFDGHSKSEPVSIPLGKNISVEHCKMLNKPEGHAIAFDGSEKIYVNDIYAYNCNAGFYLTNRNASRTSKIVIENSIIDSCSINAIYHADEVLIRNCTFIDVITTITDSTKVTFDNVKFIAKTKPCMVSFATTTSDSITFKNCTIDNTNGHNFSGAFLSIYNNVAPTNVLFEKNTFINCSLYTGVFVTGTSIKMRNNYNSDGTTYTLVKDGVTCENPEFLRITGTAKPTTGFHKAGTVYLYTQPASYIGGVAKNDGYGFSNTWSVGIGVFSPLHIKLSNGIVVRANSSGSTTAGNEPIAITSANTTSNPYTSGDGIQWVYMGTASDWHDFGAII